MYGRPGHRVGVEAIMGWFFTAVGGFPNVCDVAYDPGYVTTAGKGLTFIFNLRLRASYRWLLVGHGAIKRKGWRDAMERAVDQPVNKIISARVPWLQCRGARAWSVVHKVAHPLQSCTIPVVCVTFPNGLNFPS
eukprot:560532-Prymnesium_polylepis.1